MPELGDGLVDEAESVGAAFGELTAVRIDRQLAVQRDPPALVQPVLRLAEAAEAERLQPGDGVEREAVIEQRQVDVGRPQARSGSTGVPTDPAPAARG